MDLNNITKELIIQVITDGIQGKLNHDRFIQSIILLYCYPEIKDAEKINIFMQIAAMQFKIESCFKYALNQLVLKYSIVLVYNKEQQLIKAY